MQAFGRTPLTSVSPKKTWEGTIVGLGGCIATSVFLSRILCWPKSLLRYENLPQLQSLWLLLKHMFIPRVLIWFCCLMEQQYSLIFVLCVFLLFYDKHTYDMYEILNILTIL